MKLSPVQGAIEAVRLLLSNQLNLPKKFDEEVTPLPITILPPQYQAPPDLPTPPFTFPLPPTNPGYNDNFNPFFPPPAQPIDPNDQNQNGIPDDIDALLGGL